MDCIMKDNLDLTMPQKKLEAYNANLIKSPVITNSGFIKTSDRLIESLDCYLMTRRSTTETLLAYVV